MDKTLIFMLTQRPFEYVIPAKYELNKQEVPCVWLYFTATPIGHVCRRTVGNQTPSVSHSLEMWISLSQHRA